ncbi:MAG: methyltransferase domain-containing protein [Myxococcales bacterium]
MTPKALVPVALAAAFYVACNKGPSPVSSVEPAPPPALAEHSSGAEHDFPDPATYARELDDPQRDAWQKPREVVALLDAQPGMIAADLGVGSGYFLPYLSAAVGPDGRVIALDADRGMIGLVRSRIEEEGLHLVEPRLVDAEDPGLSARSVDRILVVDTWHHITDRTAYARKLRAALRPGGLLLIVDFDMDSPVGPPAGKRLTPESVLRELRAAGFETERLGESLPYQYAIAGRVP